MGGKPFGRVVRVGRQVEKGERGKRTVESGKGKGEKEQDVKPALARRLSQWQPRSAPEREFRVSNFAFRV